MLLFIKIYPLYCKSLIKNTKQIRIIKFCKQTVLGLMLTRVNLLTQFPMMLARILRFTGHHNLFLPLPVVSPAPALMASGEVCEGSSCWNIYWSVFLSFIYFPLFPLALPSPPRRPRNTSSAVRCQRRQRGWKSTTWNHYLAFVAPHFDCYCGYISYYWPAAS